jgi:hypothetical protein
MTTETDGDTTYIQYSAAFIPPSQCHTTCLYPTAVNYHWLSFILSSFHVASTQCQDQQSFKTTPCIIEHNTSLITDGAEPFLRRCQLCSHSRTSQYFVEPEGSLPCSQEPSIGPCPELNQSSPYHPIISL